MQSSKHVNRVVFIFTALILAVLSGFFSGCRKQLPPFQTDYPVEEQNIIFICIDTLRSDYLGVYGNPFAISPNIDRLAREGFIFSDFTSPAPWTLPVVASMFTGCLPSEHGVLAVHHRIPDSFPVLAESLQNRGYETAAFTGGAVVVPDFGFDRGFDLFEYDSFHLNDHLPNIMKYLDECVNHQPFFLFLHGYDMHAPWFHNDPFSSMFEKIFPSEIIDHRAIPINMYREGYHDLAYSRSHYNYLLMEADRIIGRLLEALEQRNLLRNTTIIITSDHGEELMDHGAFEHRFLNLYQSTIAVPMIIWNNRNIPGHIIFRPGNHIEVHDWMLECFTGVHSVVDFRHHNLFRNESDNSKLIISENHAFRKLALNTLHERFNQSWYIRAGILSSLKHGEPLLTAISRECPNCPDLITKIDRQKYRIDFGLERFVLQFCNNNPYQAAFLMLELINPSEMDDFEEKLFSSVGCRNGYDEPIFDDWDRIEFDDYVCYMPDGYEITSIYNATCVRDGAWKYIYDESSGKRKLFNFELDPSEKTNLVDLFTEKAEELHTFYLEFLDNRELRTRSMMCVWEIDEQTTEQLRVLGYIY